MAAPSGVVPDGTDVVPDPQAANPPQGFTTQTVNWTEKDAQGNQIPHSATAYNPPPNYTPPALNPTDPTGEESRGTMPGMLPDAKPAPTPSPQQTPVPKTQTPDLNKPLGEDDAKLAQATPQKQLDLNKPLDESDAKLAQPQDLNKPLGEDDAKMAQQGAIDNLSQLSKSDIINKTTSENIPDEIAIPALQASAKAHVQNPLLTLQEQAGETGQFLQGAAKGTGNLFTSGEQNPIAQLFNSVKNAASETGKALVGPQFSYDSAPDLRALLNSSGASPDDGEYQQKNALINQLSDVEKRLSVGQAPGPSMLARTEGPMPSMSDQDRQALEQQRLQLINQINPNYMKDRQLQANANVQSGVLLGGAEAARGLVGAITAAPSGIPGGRQLMDLYDAHRSSADWKNELDMRRDEANRLNAIAQGQVTPQIWGDHQIGTPSVHDQLQAEGMPVDPSRIADVANTAQLAGAFAVPDLGLGDAFAKSFLGAGSKGAEALAGVGAKAAGTAKKFAPYEIIGALGTAGMHMMRGDVGAAKATLITDLGMPAVGYVGGKLLQATGNAAGNFLGKAASDSFREGGMGANFLRRATAEAINAPIQAVPYSLISSDNPEQFGENLATMAGLHLGTRLPGEGLMAARNAAFDSLFSGAKWKDTPYQDYGTTPHLDQQSQDAIEALPKQQQNMVNSVRDYVGPGTEIHVVPKDEWQSTLNQYAPNSGGVSARGFYQMDSPPGTPQRMFVRSDSVPQALGWETGRLLHSQMPEPIKSQFDAAAAGSINMNDFTQKYFKGLTGQEVNFDSLPTEGQVANGAQPGPNGYTKEMMINAAGADAARRIFNGQSVQQLSKNPTILRSLRYGIGSLLDKMGIPTFTGDRPVTNFVRNPDGTVSPSPTGFHDYINGVHPGMQASLIMERWMRQFQNRGTVPEVPSGARPVGEGGAPTPTTPTTPAGLPGLPEGQQTTFRPSTQEQELPPGITIPSSGGVQYRVDPKTGKIMVKWNRPPDVEIPIGAGAMPTAQTQSQQQKRKAQVATKEAPQPVPVTEPTAATPAVQPKTVPALDKGQVYDRIMESEGPGSQVITTQGQHELYGFRDRDDPEAYQAIARARNEFGPGSQQEQAVVHQYLEKEANSAGMDKITNPGVQALVASMAHMRGAGGARAMLQTLFDGKLRETYGDLGDDAIAHINQMSPEQVIAHLRDIRERYDRVFYGDTQTAGGGTWWNKFQNGLRARYDREAQEALNFTNGDKDAYAKSLEASKGTTYAEAPSEGGEHRRPIGGDEEQQARQAFRQQFEGGPSVPAAQENLQTARQVMEEHMGPNWIEHVPPEVAQQYAQAEPENYLDQRRRLAALQTAQDLPTARDALASQVPVLQEIQNAGGFPSTRRLGQLGTFLEPNSEDLAEAHAAFKQLPSEQKLFLRQNYGITENKLFSNTGAPLETLRYELSNRLPQPFGSGQEILDHYYDTLSNLDRMHQGIRALTYGQFPELSQPVPRGTLPSLTQEKIQALQSAAAESVPTNTAGGRARDTSSKAYQADVEKAQNQAILEAHAQSLPQTDQRVQLYRDPDNPERLMAAGTRIVPGDPVHDLLTNGISPAEIELANRFGQAAEGGQAQTMTYRAAERRPIEGDSRQVQQREIEQELSPAHERAAGEAPGEDVTATWLPTRLSIGGLSEPGQKNILLHGLSTDKLTDNIRQIVGAAPEGYEGLKNLGHDDWARALGAYISNQRHGYKGDGTGALRGTERIKSQIDPTYQPQIMPKEIAQAINAALGDEGAKGKTPKAEAAREFAQKNLGYLSAEHEVNPLREKIREEQGPNWRLGSAWETRRADLVKEIHPSFTGGPGRIREGSEAITRAVEQQGQPRGEFVRAGFMPEQGRAAFMSEEKRTPEEWEPIVAKRIAAWNKQKDTVPMEVTRDKNGAIKLDKEGEPIYKKQDYGIRQAPEIKKLFQKYGPEKGWEKGTDLLGSRLAEYGRKSLEDPRLADAKAWYSGMTDVLQNALGANMDLMGNSLAATSPGTGVVQNFKYALHAISQLGKGAYDPLLDRFAQHVKASLDKVEAMTNDKGEPLTQKQKQTAYRKEVRQFKEIPLREGGKKYGYNSPKLLHALGNVWEEMTEGPKISDFGGALLGKVDNAVIDRWAGRGARQVMYEGKVKRWRTNDAQESGVGSGPEYDFTQQGYHKAAKELGLSNTDMQALLWYAVKQHYADRGWTNKAGSELTDFRKLSDQLRNTDRYQIGLTNYTTPENWHPEEFENLRKQVETEIRRTPGLLASRVMPSRGLFAGDGEPSLDAEFSVPRGTDISHIHDLVQRAARGDLAPNTDQHSAFISRIHNNPELPGARPSLEMGFKKPISEAEGNELSNKVFEAGLGGMSLARDPNGNIIGARTQSIPEFNPDVRPEDYENAHRLWKQNAKTFSDAYPKDNLAYAFHRSADTTLYRRENGYKTEGPGPRAAFMPGDVVEDANGKRERIRAAAIRYQNGNIYQGFSHGEAHQGAIDSGEKPWHPGIVAPQEGFLTDSGRFLTRDEAHSFAKIRRSEDIPRSAAFMPEQGKESERFGRWREGGLSTMPQQPGPITSPEDAQFRARAIARNELAHQGYPNPWESTIAGHAQDVLNRYQAKGQEPPLITAEKAIAEMHGGSPEPTRANYDISPAGGAGGSYINRNGTPISWHADADEPEMMDIRNALQEGRMALPEEHHQMAELTRNRMNTAERNLADYRQIYNPVRGDAGEYARLDDARRDARTLHHLTMQANGAELAHRWLQMPPSSEEEDVFNQPYQGITDANLPVNAARIPNVISGEKELELHDLWKTVSKTDDAFKHGVPESGSIADIAKTYSTPKLPVTISSRQGGSSLRFSNPNGYITVDGVRGRPHISATEAGSEGKKGGGGGSSLYQAAFSWAALNGKTINADILTKINELRRTSNMLSSALRHGTTEHMSPARSQGLDWWNYKDPSENYIHNVSELARQEASKSFERIPGLSKYSFDLQNGIFHDENGKEVSDSDIEKTIKARDPRFEEGVGLATAKRAIITRSVLEKGTGDQGENVEPTLQSSGGKGSPFARVLYQPETGTPVPWKPSRTALPISKVAAAASFPIMGGKRERETK